MEHFNGPKSKFIRDSLYEHPVDVLMSIEIPREDYIENGPIHAAKMRNTTQQPSKIFPFNVMILMKWKLCKMPVDV